MKVKTTKNNWTIEIILVLLIVGALWYYFFRGGIM